MARISRRDFGGRKPRSKKRTKMTVTTMLILGTIFCLLLFFYYQFEKTIMPSVLSLAEFKAKTIATAAINEAIFDVLDRHSIEAKDFVSYLQDGEGNFSSAQINTLLISKLTAEVIKEIDVKLEEVDVYYLKVPLGNLTGSDLLANFGPIIEVLIMPAGTATINYDREFREAGINQINHRVWLDINTQIQIVVPMATEEIAIDQKFVLVDHVFNGEVPPSYVNVPKDNILDVAPMPVE